MIDIKKYITNITIDNNDYSYSIETNDLFNSVDRKTDELLA